MNIAVLFGEIAYISRSRIIDGILECAKKDNSNVVLFTCEGFLFHDLKSYVAGEYEIFKLPAFENYDGVIIDIDSIQNKQMQEYLLDNINKSNIPCVSFNHEMAIGNQICFDNEQGFRELVEHIIVDHGITDICYLSGPFGNRDAIQRMDIFKNIMGEHQAKVTDDMIYEGDFNFGSGKELAQHFINSGKKLPRAFVCANDYMAIGLMEELKENGIKIPEDVIITGYDNCEVSGFTSPRLTTVDRGEFEAGVLAYQKLIRNINKSEKRSFNQVSGKPIFSETCGCSLCKNTDENDTSSDTKKISLVDTKMHMDQSLDLIKGLTIELSGIANIDSFERSLEKYISKMGMDYFYFCQCGSRESYYDELETLASGEKIKRDMTIYPDTVWCPIAYEKGEWNNYPKFSSKLLFPPQSKYNKEGTYYIVMPVHQAEICIGYSIIGNFDEYLSGRVLQHLILGIDEALGNIRRNDIMTTMLAKINQKWQYDELTGLYNRSGMIQNAQNLINEAASEGNGIAVFFFDLDGLKAINDSKGHEAGDEYIVAMAKMLKKGTSDKDIVIRYGGDEYIVIAKRTSWDDSLKLLNTLQENIVEPVSASGGCVFDYISQMDELNTLIEEADKKMYASKKIKKYNRTV